MSRSPRITVVRCIALSVILFFAALLTSQVRSWSPGSSPHGLALVTLLTFGPLVYLAVINMAWKRRILIAIVLPLVLGVVIDTYATIEERWFVKKCSALPPTADEVYHDRWWPNGSSFLYYDPKTGTLGGGD